MAKYKLFMPQDFLTENQTEFPTLLNLLPKDVFPFAEPPGLALPSMIIFPEIHEAPLHTTNASTTKTASAVEGLLHTEQELRELRQAPELWQNLARYADMATDRPYPSTFTARPAGSDIPEPLGLPSAQQQADAIYQIWAWFLYHHLRDEVAVTGEVGVQDVFQRHLIEPLNILNKMRYPNRIHGGEAEWPDREPASPVPEKVNFPVWGRSCNEVRPDAGTPSRRKAGHPDWILFREPDRDCNVCLAEAKTWWSYPSWMFHRILTNDTATNGVFDWTMNGADDLGSEEHGNRFSDTSKSWLLTKQLWGEIIFYHASWGFVTNGKVIMVYVKTGEHQLTFSPVLDVRDRILYRAMAGLCFAAVDGRREDGSDSMDLINLICGPRDFNWPPPGEQPPTRRRLPRRRRRTRNNPAEDDDDGDGDEDRSETEGMDVD